jgi:hypothetical protein
MLTAGLLAGWGGILHADVYLGKAKYENTTPIKSAEDAVSAIPFLKKLPTSFFIGDGFKFKLNGDALRIDHMGTRSAAPAHKRNCLISLSYTTPVAFFGSRVEMPLFFSETPRPSRWAANTFGDYVVHLSKDAAVEHPILGLSISAKF